MSSVDARVKIALLTISSIALFLSTGPVAVALWVVVLAAVLHSCSVPIDTALGAAKPAAAILVLTVLFNALVVDGSASIGLAGPVGISIAGAHRAAAAVSRIILLAGLVLAFASCTRAEEVSEAVLRLLRPLSVVGVPIQGVALALSLALGFFPVVSLELSSIRSAQESRGANFSSGPLFERLRVWVAVFTPLIIALFRRADRLAISMEARCYREDRPREVVPLPLRGRDVFALVGGLLLISAIVLLSRFGCQF